MVICLDRGADLNMAQLMPLPLTVSCFIKIQVGFTFLVPAHLGSPGKGPLNGCVCVCIIFLAKQTLKSLKSYLSMSLHTKHQIDDISRSYLAFNIIDIIGFACGISTTFEFGFEL